MYIHCLCHRLNLSLQTACAEILEVRNCLGTVNSLFNFINGSAKRLQIFRNTQSGTNGTTLKQHCETRWSSRKNSIKSLAQNYEFVLETLHFIQETDKTPAGSNSTSLLKASKDFEFLFVLQVLYLVFERTGMFSDALQDSQIEIDRSIRLKTTTVNSLHEIKTNDEFGRIFEKCKRIAEENDIDEPKLPRKRKIPDRFRDTMPESIEFKSIIEKYKDLYFKIVESTISQIDERFSDETLEQILSIAKILKGLADENEIDKIEAWDTTMKCLTLKS